MKTTTFFGENVGERSLVALANTMSGCSCHPRALERRDDPSAMRVRRDVIFPTLEHQRKYPQLYWWLRQAFAFDEALDDLGAR